MIRSFGLAKCASRSSSLPSLWLLASCATTVVAARNCTECPATIASRPSATARCVLPTSGGPSSSTFSPLAIQRAPASSRTCLESMEGCAAKSKPQEIAHEWEAGKLQGHLDAPLVLAGDLRHRLV